MRLENIHLIKKIGIRWFYEIKKEKDKNIVLFRLTKNGNKNGGISMEKLSEKPNPENYKHKDETEKEDKKKEKNNAHKTEEFILINSSIYLAKIIYVLLTIIFYSNSKNHFN